MMAMILHWEKIMKTPPRVFERPIACCEPSCGSDAVTECTMPTATTKPHAKAIEWMTDGPWNESGFSCEGGTRPRRHGAREQAMHTGVEALRVRCARCDGRTRHGDARDGPRAARAWRLRTWIGQAPTTS
jgi:hypothetical protein